MYELTVSVVLNGAFYAGVLFLMSAGLQVIFGVLGIVNFAHAAFYTLGIYLTFAIITAFSSVPPILLLMAPILAAVVVGVLGLVFERGLLKFIYHRDDHFQILVTLAVVYIVDDFVRFKWGGYPVSVSPIIPSSLEIAGVIYPVYYLVIIGVAIFLAVSLWYLFQKTSIGRVVRAVSHDEEITEALGINVTQVKAATFLFGSAIAGLAGGLMLPISGGWPGVGLEYLILTFVVIVLAGLGNINGALVTALLVGMVRSIGIQLFPKIELAIVFILMAIILTVRPSGLFGRNNR
jgi:branched-chain amino acid transport system permease protein